MKNIIITAFAFAIGIAVSGNAMAETMSKDQYKLAKKNIAKEYKVADKACDSLSGNAEDICEAQAKGAKNTAKAELEDKYKPTIKTRYDARAAKANADFSVAKQKCDDKDGNVEDVCEKEAKAANVQEIAAAEAQLKTSKADAVAIEKSSDARKDAETDMRDANYAVAKEKCDVLADDAKDLCISNAKAHFDRK